MEILNLKDSVEKDSFFRKLPNTVEQLPRQIVLKKLLPLLASALEFGSAAAALTPLLKMGSWLSTEEFNMKVLPTVVKLFASNDRAIRVGLLQHIDQFGESLSAQTVDEQVFPHVATGFSDSSAFLRELTLKSMLILAPKLSHRTLSGTLLKYLSKLQVDEEPAIRTNTTILLGNIASYLNEGTRKRVLINAFTVRALRDTFSPARVAGVMALSATSSYYDMTEIATRILPNIVVLAIDPDGAVRTEAFQAIDHFLLMAKQYHEKLNTGDTGGGTSGGTSLIPENASLLGWAMNSLTLKGKPSEHAAITSGNATTSLTSTTSNVTSSITSSDAMAVHASPSISAPDQPQPSSPTSTDGWGELENGLPNDDHDSDKEGWDAIDSIEEPKPAAFASIQAAQKRPIVQPQSQAATNSSRPKEEDDLWGAIAAPPPKTSAKSLHVKPPSSDDDDLWGSIAAPPPRSASRPQKKATVDESDPWAAIAAPPPSTRAKPLSLGRGRGTKAAPAKLRAQRIDRAPSA